MKLSALMENIAVTGWNVSPDTCVSGICYDSRKVKPGDVFIAVSGFATDGNRFIPSALAKGACAVITARKPEEDVPYVLVKDDRLAMAQAGANFYNNPAKAMTLIGVTGTNGKTSVTLMLKHILETVAGAKVGLIGTTGNMIGHELIPSEHTTPESVDLQALLAAMRDSGCSHVIMEVSSHALALERVGGLHFRVAAFTNLTEDHLDFHKTMDAYSQAKALLFQRCDKAVANLDDPWYSRVCSGAQDLLLTSGKQPADLCADQIRLYSSGVSFQAHTRQECCPVEVPIPGSFTVSNVLTALGICLQLQLPLESCARALKSAAGVKGRVEVVPTPGTDYTVMIDFAHTPDGLENVLSSVKGFCKGSLIAVFGCGGDRDPVKRPIMGRIGTQLADFAVITSDNPRTEDPAAIIRDVLKGVDPESNNYCVMENRVQAIAYAMDIAKKDDIIVLAGKGHETYQEICGVRYPMDEREIVAQILAEKRN